MSELAGERVGDTVGDAIELELGGVLRLALVGAGPRERRAVARQLGLVERPASGAGAGAPADLTLRFVERLTPTGDLRWIGLQDAAFTDDAFLLLRGKHKSRACVAIPFEKIGGPCELTCERGLAAVPMLVPILNATLLAKGYLPLHAAAFLHRGRGVLATGWSKGGKTETLLAFLAQGARYVADEWLYLAPEGARMFGIPEPVRVWDWHLDSLPELRGRLTLRERSRLALLGWIADGMKRVTDDGRRHGSAATRTLNRASALLETQRCVDLPPERLFESAVNGSTPLPADVRPERILFVVSHERPEITVQPIEARAVAERMLFSLAEEDQRLTSCYHKFRFAFPARANAFLERRDERRRELLQAALEGRPAFEVRHPYPVSLPALYDALREVCG